MKTFVLDTNVLLYDPQALFKFEEHSIIVPITVIEEIDRFKKDMNETGRKARQVSRILDQLRKNNSLSEGVHLESGGTLRVESAPGRGTRITGVVPVAVAAEPGS